jgi:hypothetical protein
MLSFSIICGLTVSFCWAKVNSTADCQCWAIRDLTEEWLDRKYHGLTAGQRLVMTRAIFEEAITDMRRIIPDIVQGVLERYGFVPPSRRAKPIAAPVQLAGR